MEMNEYNEDDNWDTYKQEYCFTCPESYINNYSWWCLYCSCCCGCFPCFSIEFMLNSIFKSLNCFPLCLLLEFMCCCWADCKNKSCFIGEFNCYDILCFHNFASKLLDDLDFSTLLNVKLYCSESLKCICCCCIGSVLFCDSCILEGDNKCSSNLKSFGEIILDICKLCFCWPCLLYKLLSGYDI